MFGLEKLFQKENISVKELAKLLKTSPEALQKFNAAYKKYTISNDETTDNLFEMSVKSVSEKERTRWENFDISEIDPLVNRIVDELVKQTPVYHYERGGQSKNLLPYPSSKELVTKAEIEKLPLKMRPQLTGTLMQKDIAGTPSYINLLDLYIRSRKESDPKKRKGYYCRFRQGLDILDLDGVVYEMLGMNPNAIGNWLPKIAPAVDKFGFFKIPTTTIIKVPMSVLQLTRLDYQSLTPVTKKIVCEFCSKVFNLDVEKEYFIKTGTFSSKFDFRNAKVAGADEVRTLGEYLLFVHFQANSMAHYDLSNRKQPVIFGVSTTNEWCVREFIVDKDNSTEIYNGMKLHTEYRVFVDFDTKTVLGVHNYWDPEKIKSHLDGLAANGDVKAVHDRITFEVAEEALCARYEANKDKVCSAVQEFLGSVKGLSGQWSIDVMQNGDDFWLIDTAIAESSVYYLDTVPRELRRSYTENWIPSFDSLDFDGIDSPNV